MNGYFARFLLLLTIFSSVACKKNNRAINDSGIVGNWVWVNSSMGSSILITPDTGVRKNLSFTEGGTLYITHNDSTGNIGNLQVYDPLVILAKMITDTTTYQITTLNAGCVSIKFPALITNVNTDYYNYSISNDTLQVSPPPCLAPLVSTYVRE